MIPEFLQQTLQVSMGGAGGRLFRAPLQLFLFGTVSLFLEKEKW